MRYAKYFCVLLLVFLPLLSAKAETDYLFYLGRGVRQLNYAIWYPSVAWHTAPGGGVADKYEHYFLPGLW